MFDILRNGTFAKLFAAQIVALLGTGLLTVALGLLAFDLAGDSAGAVLGTALAIKMVAYVTLAPIANALTDRVSTKTVLVGADAIRAFVAAFLPFVDSIWQVYVAIFVLQAASATFTPTLQAIIPDLLPDDDDYTKALSLTRLASELENLVSPLLAGVMLLFLSFHWLFAGTFLGFVASGLLVISARLPSQQPAQTDRSFRVRLTQGARIYLRTPRLRGLLGLNLTVASVGAFVIVNTVVIVKSGYGGSETDVAYALAAFGAGAMLAALGLPALLQDVSDRTVMILSAFGLCIVAFFHSAWMAFSGLLPWSGYLAIWFVSGLLFSATITPSGRLLKRSAHPSDRRSVFVAQFTLSHACWLFTYPLAGWGGLFLGMPGVSALFASLGLLGVAVAILNWPASDPSIVAHDHPDLPPDHPHLSTSHSRKGTHEHAYVIDDYHSSWPK